MFSRTSRNFHILNRKGFAYIKSIINAAGVEIAYASEKHELSINIAVSAFVEK